LQEALVASLIGKYFRSSCRPAELDYMSILVTFIKECRTFWSRLLLFELYFFTFLYFICPEKIWCYWKHFL